MELVVAKSEEELETAKQLFIEYAESLDFDLCLQGFHEEIADLRNSYLEPKGCIFLARESHQTAGCVAIRSLENPLECEMKRLYVRPPFRKHGIGRSLAQTAIMWAYSAGFSVMRLDTLDTMTTALQLYKSLGFLEGQAYGDNPIACARFLELKLEKPAKP